MLLKKIAFAIIMIASIICCFGCDMTDDEYSYTPPTVVTEKVITEKIIPETTVTESTISNGKYHTYMDSNGNWKTERIG